MAPPPHYMLEGEPVASDLENAPVTPIAAKCYYLYELLEQNKHYVSNPVEFFIIKHRARKVNRGMSR
jgi:hypothetical protein